MNPDSTVMEQALQQTAEQARQLSPDAAYYWTCHAPRYRYIAELIEASTRSTPVSRVLDVGMGFETGVLARILRHARLDCLGAYEDTRFQPPRPFTFFRADLNHPATAGRPPHVEPYDLLVCMEVIEHLYAPPELVLQALASWITDTGTIVLTTPNAAWLKNRIKMVCGKNPFELLRPDTRNMGHIREYTRSELQRAIAAAGLRCVHSEVRGLYRFNNAKDNFYSALADLTLPTLRRTLVAVCEKRRAEGAR